MIHSNFWAFAIRANSMRGIASLKHYPLENNATLGRKEGKL